MAPSLEETTAPSSISKPPGTEYKCVDEARRLFEVLLADDTLCLPSALKKHAQNVTFYTSTNMRLPPFPCPFKQTENIAILKGLESSIAAAIADVRYGARERKIKVSLEKSARYLMSAYICTVDGMGKLEPGVKARLKDTDLNKAQSIIYRRFSSNLYATKRPDEYFHLHGSLEATTALNMIGLPAYNDEITEYKQAIDHIECKMKEYTCEELEEKNQANRQAGVKAYKREEIAKTEYGKIFEEPLWSVDTIEDRTPPAPFPLVEAPRSSKRILSGIKVIEMCRVIAGPSIARILTEYGADVIKITSPELSDVPWFQIEGNMGKHTAALNLRLSSDRAIFESLLAEADVLVDGYRHGALERLSYGIKMVKEMASKRGKGMVYVSENCFGYGKWADRPGWQQIADCVSGVAWEQGKFMGLTEPIVPPFPMSDYGTGLMGAISALIGLYHRATKGGSYHAKVCLVQYDNLLFKLGMYPQDVQNQLREKFAGPYFDLRHNDHTDVFSGAALATLKEVAPELLDNEDEFTETWWSEGYNADVKVVGQVADIEGVETGYYRGSRPNGSDAPSWAGWEFDQPSKIRSL